MSDKDLIIELLEISEESEDGTIDFNNRAKEIIMELAEKYRKTPIYKQVKKKMPEWVDTATAAEIYIQMCDRIIEAPTIIHMINSIKILIPILWKKIQEEEGKVYFYKPTEVGTTEFFLDQIGEIFES